MKELKYHNRNENPGRIVPVGAGFTSRTGQVVAAMPF